MTRKKALKELLVKVKAGDLQIEGCMFRAFGDNLTHFFDAYNGSLDAAKALHEAVFDGWVYGVNFDAHKEIYAFVGDGVCYETDECYSDNPARAWLIAILKALIAIDDATTRK